MNIWEKGPGPGISANLMDSETRGFFRVQEL